jgi:peptidoglycan hydrolase-like protein with peptidoglycan-binding domain
MWLCRSSILIISCLACLGIDPSQADTIAHDLAFSNIKLAQTTVPQTNSPPPEANQNILKPGNSGLEVEALQTKLKSLGFYDGVVDGDYGQNTSNAVAKFQTSKGLEPDGRLGATTRQKLEAAIGEKSPSTPPTPSPTPQPKTNGGNHGIIWWGLIGLGLLGTTGALAFFIRNFKKPKSEPTGFKVVNSEVFTENESKVIPQLPAYTEPTTIQQLPSLTQTTVVPDIEHVFEVDNQLQSEYNFDGNGSYDISATSTELLPPEKTNRLAKVNIVDELVIDLRSSDPNVRRKAIWDLGQQGDSRAIQPLVDIMMDADSQQRSMILAALSEIGTRTLKPMNRALAISLQDESPEVRQNAIRDLTRVYDLMAQVSQMLCHAAQDSDPQVQATAKYALSQMNKIRALPSQDFPQS